MNKKSFDNLTEEEKKAIYIWTNSTHEYRHIKRIFQGNYLDDFLKEYLPTANLLRGLFEKYIDNTEKKNRFSVVIFLKTKIMKLMIFFLFLKIIM